MGPSEQFQILIQEVKRCEQLFWYGQDLKVWKRFGAEWEINGKIERPIPCGTTYASNTRCGRTYMQISCLSVHLDCMRSALRVVKMACVAVMTNPKQVTMAISGGISRFRSQSRLNGVAAPVGQR